MASYLSLKMKRKELEEVSDDFSDFSLSSPARKIRRLDAELPPIMEEVEHDVPLEHEQLLPEKQVEDTLKQVDGPPLNAERAMVLFKPLNSPLLLSPSKFSVSVDSDFISGFKNQFPWVSQSAFRKSEEGEAESGGRNIGITNECLAVVSWAPSQFPQASNVEVPQILASELVEEEEMGATQASNVEVPQVEASELVEEEEMGATTMDIEDNLSPEEQQEHGFGGMMGSECLHQWRQQQYCMTPQLPRNMSTPITWFR